MGGRMIAADLGQGDQLAQVAEVERGLAHHDDQAAPFLQGDVARARDQRVGVAGGEGGDGLHAAGGHDHPLGAERAAGHRGADVAVVVDDVGEAPPPSFTEKSVSSARVRLAGALRMRCSSKAPCVRSCSSSRTP